MRNCVTHHHACDCREEMFAEIERQRDELLSVLKDISDSLPSDDYMSADGVKPGPLLVKMRAAIAKAEAAS